MRAPGFFPFASDPIYASKIEKTADGSRRGSRREKGATLAILSPRGIQEHGKIIGILRLRKPEGHPWSKEELTLVENLTEQLYLALENARLYSESQRRAERERLASNIVARMRTSNDPQVILQTAVQELRQAFMPHQERPLPPMPDPAPSQPENGKSRAG